MSDPRHATAHPSRGPRDSEAKPAGASIGARWWRAFSGRSIPVRGLAVLAWLAMAYLVLIGLMAALYSRPAGQAVSGPVYLITRPMEFYLDLRDALGLALDSALAAFCLFGIWVLVSPFLPGRRKPGPAPARSEARGEVTPGEAPPVIDEPSRDERLISRSEKESEPELPEHIRRMITRFVDIRTLQPRGVLRSVIILLHSEIESYRHLLRTGDCLKSLEKLRQMPPDIFDTDECREMLREEGYETAFSQLGLQFSELVPALIERIEGQLDESVVRVSRAVAESGSSLGISWYVQNLVTRFIDLRTLQPVGVLRSVLILLNSNIESYHELLRSPDCRASMDKLRSLPPDAFDNEDCRELLRRKKYADLLGRLNLKPSELVPTLLARIESDREHSGTAPS